MNLILLERGEIGGARVTLTDRRAEHIVKVLRAELGDTVRVGITGGARGSGTIAALKKKFPFSAELSLAWTEGVEPQPRIDLLLALPRPIMLRRILSQAAALGVGRIFLVNARRVEKSFWDATALAPDAIREHLLAGLEQAMATRVPEVTVHPRFKPFVEDVLPGGRDQYALRILGHPGAKMTLNEVISAISAATGRVLMAVGPEGGWIDYEVEKLQEQGFVSCTMGSRILKVDTAVIAMHAQISVLIERNPAA